MGKARTDDESESRSTECAKECIGGTRWAHGHVYREKMPSWGSARYQRFGPMTDEFQGSRPHRPGLLH